MEWKREGDWVQREGILVEAAVGKYSKVEFSTHALDQMAIRNITQEQVLDALSSPTETGWILSVTERELQRESILKSRCTSCITKAQIGCS